MRKGYFWPFILIVSFALIGLVLAQSYWIRNAYEVKERQFDLSVSKSIARVSQQLERNEAVNMVRNQLYTNPGNINSVASQLFNQMGMRNHSDADHEAEGNYSYSEEIHMIHDGEKSQYGEKVTIYQNDSVVYSSEDIQSHDKVLQQSFQGNLHNRKAFIENIIQQMTSPNVDLTERIDQKGLSQLINKELATNAIDLHFEFAVLDEDDKAKICTDKYKQVVKNTKYRCQLYPNDLMHKPYFLSLYFPHKNKFIFGSLGVMGLSSLVLALIVMFGYSYTVFIIFKQKKLSEMKSDFVNNITHELKTPISTISLASQMLKDESIPKESKDLGGIAGIIQDESKRLSYQVEKVLQVAVAEKATIKLKRTRVDVHEIIETVITNFEINVTNKGGELSTDLLAEDAVVSVDEHHFTNVIFNLFDNALKYTPETPRIKIKTQNTRQGLQIQISDNGIGIPGSDQKRIFDKFYRVPTGDVHNVKGSGLGLSYVKRIVEEHDGTIFVTSELNKGSIFYIDLPNT